ncbi:hypothetical protein C7M84_013708 [Penaeus vannamei]|uniref:Uncharacterized protein n=1 Tax=Penaeus vannamei TaxID=6689 RepID=A0A423SVE1_PENVA|nr:hypothetical protein C7M84_013708 [Penaeus vannamei]
MHGGTLNADEREEEKGKKKAKVGESAAFPFTCPSSPASLTSPSSAPPPQPPSLPFPCLSSLLLPFPYPSPAFFPSLSSVFLPSPPSPLSSPPSPPFLPSLPTSLSAVLPSPPSLFPPPPPSGPEADFAELLSYACLVLQVRLGVELWEVGEPLGRAAGDPGGEGVGGALSPPGDSQGGPGGPGTTRSDSSRSDTSSSGASSSCCSSSGGPRRPCLHAALSDPGYESAHLPDDDRDDPEHSRRQQLCHSGGGMSLRERCEGRDGSPLHQGLTRSRSFGGLLSHRRPCHRPGTCAASCRSRRTSRCPSRRGRNARRRSARAWPPAFGSACPSPGRTSTPSGRHSRIRSCSRCLIKASTSPHPHSPRNDIVEMRN